MPYGPAVTSVFTSETSAEPAAVPPLPVLSVLFDGSGSWELDDALALLSNGPAALIVAVTVIVSVSVPERFGGAGVQGKAEQPEPVTLVMVRFVGVSVIDTMSAA